MQTDDCQPEIRTVALAGLALLSAATYLTIYTTLHEAGHAITGLWFGQELSGFNIRFWDLSAHVSLSGALSPAQSAVQSAAGAVVPTLVWAIFMGLTSRRVNLQLHLFRLIASFGILGSLTVWVLLPLFRLSGGTFAGDDVTRFLQTSGIPPLVLSLISGALLLAGLGLLIRRAGGIKEQAARLDQLRQAGFSTADKRTLTALISIAAILLLGSLAADRSAKSASTRPPEGFQLAAEVQLDQGGFEEQILASFTLTGEESVSLYYVVNDLDTEYLDLQLIGANGIAVGLVHGEGWQANHASGEKEARLPAGDYRIVLTADHSPGTLQVFINRP